MQFVNIKHIKIGGYIQHLEWLSINKRCQYKILVMTFKALYSQVPTYMCDLLHWYTPARTLWSASTTSLVPNRSKTVRHGKRLFDLMEQLAKYYQVCYQYYSR